MVDWTFGVGDLITIVLVVVGALSAFLYQRYSIESTKIRADEGFNIAKTARDDLAEFKLLVAEKYIRAESLEKMEQRLVASEARMIATIEALTKRVDALIDRMDAKSEVLRSTIMDEDQPDSPWPITVAAVLLMVAIIGLFILVLTGPARAQGECGDFKAMKQALLDRYQEQESGFGLIGNHAVLMLFASPNGETWTVLAVGPDGRACTLHSGNHWTPNEMPKAPVEGERES